MGKIDSDIINLTRNLKGFTYTYIKKDEKFIFTHADGVEVFPTNALLSDGVGRTLEQVLPNHLYETVRIYFEYAWNGEICRFDEHTENGVWVNTTLIPIKHGEMIVEVMGIVLDVTDVKKLESVQLEQVKDLTSKHKMITDNLSDVITILTRDEQIIYASPSFYKMFGYHAEEKHDSYYHFLEEDKNQIHQAFNQIITTQKSVTKEVRAKNGKGQMIHIESQGVPVMGESGEVEYVVVMSRDITERKRTEEYLRNREKIATAGELAASIAHEIRNPLTSLKGFIQLFQQSGFASEEHLSIVLSELDRINLIVGELLMLGKPQISHYNKVNLNSVIEDVLKLMRSQANLSNIQFQVDPFVQTYFVFGEVNHLKQLFINIIKNSLEASPEGGSIKLTHSVDYQRLAIRITDEGCGISDTILNKIGDPFFTTKDKGSGLGMMISKKIVEDHKGEISIKSTVGVGTIVEILLPLIDSNS